MISITFSRNLWIKSPQRRLPDDLYNVAPNIAKFDDGEKSLHNLSGQELMVNVLIVLAPLWD